MANLDIKDLNAPMPTSTVNTPLLEDYCLNDY